jgi:hypothetical protein
MSEDRILEMIRAGDLERARQALAAAVAADPSDQENAARLKHVEGMIRRRAAAARAPATPSAPENGGRSWIQTSLIAGAILGAGWLIAHRPEPAPPSPPPAPPVSEELAASPRFGDPTPPHVPTVPARPAAPNGVPIHAAPPGVAPVAAPTAPLAPPPGPGEPTGPGARPNRGGRGAPPPPFDGQPEVAPPIIEPVRIRCERDGSPGCAVAVGFDGGRLLLQVDTGADITLINAEAARRVGLRWDSRSPVLTMRGVGGTTNAVLARTAMSVGSAREEDVLVTVGSFIGRTDGLLGMTFLERYQAAVGGGELRMLPLDATEAPRPGGHGRSWWLLRFRTTQHRLDRLSQLIGVARDADRKIAGEIGVDPNQTTNEELTRRFQAFSQAEQDDLYAMAGRYGVPLEWRR